MLLACTACSEIILRPHQFCNLTEVIIREHDDIASLKRQARLATILGTFQVRGACQGTAHTAAVSGDAGAASAAAAHLANGAGLKHSTACVRSHEVRHTHGASFCMLRMWRSAAAWVAGKYLFVYNCQKAGLPLLIHCCLLFPAVHPGRLSIPAGCVELQHQPGAAAGCEPDRDHGQHAHERPAGHGAAQQRAAAAQGTCRAGEDVPAARLVAAWCFSAPAVTHTGIACIPFLPY